MIVTVLTPTFNRGGSLNNLYQSLQKQTIKDFEWLLVDDGSTDDTKNIAEEMRKKAEFPMRYIYKENGGKHTALNVGVKQITSELTFIVDSDDKLVPDAIETILQYHKKYKERKDLCGYSFLRRFPDGNINGKSFEPDEKVGTYIECRINADDTQADKWFRAYFNHGLINYIYGQKRLLPCDMSFDTFFIDPYGDVMPCNGTKDKEVMGNLNNQTWDELWNSPEAEKVRAKVRCCDRDCWMIGSVSPAMHKYIWKPATWVLVHKFKALFTKHPYSMYELKICRDYRDGKVTKENLDKCSTCDMNCVINNGLSEASKEQLKHKTGEEIVDADIAAQQMETK